MAFFWDDSGGSGGQGGALGFPVEKRIQTTHKDKVEQLKEIPENCDTGTVEQEAEEASRSEMQAAAMGMVVRARIRRLNAAINQYGHHATWQGALMNAAVKTGRIEARFARSVGMYELGMAEARGMHQGYSEFHSEGEGVF